MPAIIFQKDLDSIAKDLGIADGSDFAAVATSVREKCELLAKTASDLAAAKASLASATASLATATAENGKLDKESLRLRDGWRATSDELQTAKLDAKRLGDALEAANADIERLRGEVARADEATERAEAALDAEQQDHRVTKRNAESNEKGLRTTHADILKAKDAQIANLNALVAKLNADAEEMKASHAKALADAAETLQIVKLDHAQALADAAVRRNTDLAAVRAQADAEVAAARDLIDRVRAHAKGV